MNQPISWNYRFAAPAKINLFLHVVGVLENGYHALQTVFQLIDWSDFLWFEKCANGKILFPESIPGIQEDHNLCLRAARALQQASGCTHGAAIFLEKNLPLGAGLGGGSSDAATTLLALNHLWQLHWPRQALITLAQQLGADVPFFLLGKNAFAEGFGEQLSALNLPRRFYLLVTPNVHCSTAQIFQHPRLCRTTPKISRHSWSMENTHNDLESVATQLFPELKNVAEELKKSVPLARMTGSGSAFFAPFESAEKAQEISAQFTRYPTKVVQGLAEHPLSML